VAAPAEHGSASSILANAFDVRDPVVLALISELERGDAIRGGRIS
jgi:hypothetical protein